MCDNGKIIFVDPDGVTVLELDPPAPIPQDEHWIWELQRLANQYPPGGMRLLAVASFFASRL